jgi:hypothetical protein
MRLLFHSFCREQKCAFFFFILSRQVLQFPQNRIQSDQKENKPEEALQIIIGHVMAESYANKRSTHRRRQFVVSNAKKSYLMNFRLWNYNYAFYYYYLIMEKMYKINKSNILHSQEWVIYLPNATPMVSRFFGEMSNKCQF